MAISVINWAIAKTILERDRPNADPDDINRLSVVAALVPGVAGLLVPFVVENNLPETTSPTRDEIQQQIKATEAKLDELRRQLEKLGSTDGAKDKGAPVTVAAK
jgi:hypothetical protein